ncbi:carbonic anhydrase [Beijerinckia indica]|uniref:carbonic anhydrase n=1 Tax=Beijerinckia indica subsp. indica (strain ATCC 9039 / DSM 1715 / NCIMB 8712) TaxID=395963 RepID=B2IF61_BEII9|nr:carbonic anhydrase [Beijerinckia indica]ACB95626.1 carbonic anhydrase [Beijerinckia indica subsp. indica ATCC 9039]
MCGNEKTTGVGEDEHNHLHIDRRALFGLAAMTGLLPSLLQAEEVTKETAKVPTPPVTLPKLDADHQAILDDLLAGHSRFLANTPREKDFTAKRVLQSEGQSPAVAILSCSDSRVPPETLFDQGPGSLFIVRIAGNFVTDEGLASLEFGTKVLGAKLILVLGHTHCGAVNAAIKVLQENAVLPGHIQDLVRNIKPAVAPELANKEPDLEDRAVAANVRYNVERLKQATPILSELVADGTVVVIGGVYDIETGRVSLV